MTNVGVPRKEEAGLDGKVIRPGDQYLVHQ